MRLKNIKVEDLIHNWEQNELTHPTNLFFEKAFLSMLDDQYQDQSRTDYVILEILIIFTGSQFCVNKFRV